MDNTIAQIASITAYAKTYLSQQNGIFDLSNSTATFCNKIEFAEVDRKDNQYKEIILAPSPVDLLISLNDSKVTDIVLHHLPSSRKDIIDRMSAAFVGGGRWLMEARHGNTSDFWEGRWEVTDENNPNRKIWKVTYFRIAKDYATAKIRMSSLDAMYGKLKSAIAAIEQFANDQKLERWRQRFQTSYRCLHMIDPLEETFHKDLIPKNSYSLRAQQILAACQFCWVFGGMGTWNDLGFKGDLQKKYDEVSECLFWTAINSIIVSINSFVCKHRSVISRLFKR